MTLASNRYYLRSDKEIERQFLSEGYKMRMRVLYPFSFRHALHQQIIAYARKHVEQIVK